ncbi:hypothetical protein K443DRAFT_327403, partial [Laccaria amethystina LaAM-08-1]
ASTRSVIADLARPSSLRRQNQNTTFSRFCLYNPSGVTVSRSRRPDWPVRRRTTNSVSRCQFCLLYLLQRPFSNLQPTQFQGQVYLEAEFDTVDLLPQGLVSADVLREYSQSRDAELGAVD